MREIAKRTGHAVSASTVHNVFRSSRVPSWTILEHVVRALGGDRGEFLGLWQAAVQADSEISASVGNGRQGGAAPDGGMPRPSQRIWSNEIPPRNHNFTGRVDELRALQENLQGTHPPHVQVIAGLGGIGKTEIAVEYIHRNFNKYEIIWWIRAEHHDRVRDALVRLGQRLELREATTDGGRDRTITAVLDTLQSDARTGWLLVYDNAVTPVDLQRYLPASRPGGHIIMTSRQLNWPSYLSADGIEVGPFSESEAIAFLRRRVRSLASRDLQGQLSQLAESLGYLPIALEHAAAYLAETGESADEYRIRFAENAHELLSEQPGDLELPAPVSGTWAMSTKLLTPDAEHLFNLCAFFSPEPVAAELFLHGNRLATITSPPGLAELLTEPQRFRAAASQLHRLSLARYDGARDLLQVHRVVQAVTKSRLRQDRFDMYVAYRTAVDEVLAASNPGNPDHSSSDAAYDLSLQHLESDYTTFLNSRDTALRGLIIDQVRLLHLRGGYVEAMQFGRDALRSWRELLGEDDLQVLTMAVEVAVAMSIGGRAADADELILSIRPLLQRYTSGDGYRVLLLCENIYGAGLRTRGQFREALDLDLRILSEFEQVFGVDHERTLNVRNNIAADYRQLGQFQDALATDRRTLEDRQRILGPTDPITLNSHSAIARDERSLGNYQRSLDIARDVTSKFAAIHGPEHQHWLSACDGFATALRKAGHPWDALQEGEHVLQRYHAYLGADHMYTLRAAANLINARRAVGDLAGAEHLARETRDLCLGSSPPDDVLFATLVNLASVLRVAQRPAEALLYDEQAKRGLLRIYGDQHPFTLAANINYASDLAACDRLGEAIQLGHETLAKCAGSLGADHPDTLMAGANLALDDEAAGYKAAARQRLDDVLQRYATTLTPEHPEARAAQQGARLTAEIEPYA
jgi:tetratricopeptide (TPR) repeat protein